METEWVAQAVQCVQTPQQCPDVFDGHRRVGKTVPMEETVVHSSELGSSVHVLISKMFIREELFTSEKDFETLPKLL